MPYVGPSRRHKKAVIISAASVPDDSIDSKRAGEPGQPTSVEGGASVSDKAENGVATVNRWMLQRRKSKLESLRIAADNAPGDAAKQAAYYRLLNKTDPAAMVTRYQTGKYAGDAECVLEYMRALVLTDGIDKYSMANSKRGSAQDNVAVIELLSGMQAQALGKDGLQAVGLTDRRPVHVLLVDPARAGGGSKPLQLLREILLSFLLISLFGVGWLVGTSALRKYVSGVVGSSAATSTNSVGAPPSASSYAPKEYSKDNLPEKSVKTFADVKGCDEAKAELEEIVEYLKHPQRFTRLGGKLPKGVLLTGPPGTGKTLLARAIAGEAGVPFFFRAGSEFEEMFVGVGSRRVRALFAAAKKKAPCIVFIDEIDAVGGSRRQWESHTRKTLNQLLVEMDGFEANEGIIVLAATNLPETLDSALTRPGRFDRIIHVPNPDVRGRKEILQHYLADKPLAPDVDVAKLARGTSGFSGADLANLVNVAAVKAALDNAEVVTNAQLEFAKDRILMGSERKSAVISDESRKLTAYHESGHAVVALNTEGAMPVHKATITPRGNALGMVTQLPDKDETSISMRQMLAKIDVCMGGRVAEEMVFGADHITTGARSDLQQATALARHMITECGMSKTLGPVYVDTSGPAHPSRETQVAIDSEIMRLLKESYTRAQRLLTKHEKDLHKLANALLESETLTGDEIRMTLGVQEDKVPHTVL
eukprot:jgi/Mesvir1/20589/Mv14826-RA.1